MTLIECFLNIATARFIYYLFFADCNNLMSLIEKWCPGDKGESSFDRRTATTSAQRYWEVNCKYSGA